VFLRFLRGCGVADESIALSVNCHLNNGLSSSEIEAWWLAQLGLPAGCLRAASIARRAPRAGAANVHVHGTACTRVHSTFLVQSIYGAIQEYAGFERPEWLD